MTPKEKAQELVDKHKTLFKHYDANPRLNIGLNEYFKKCAIKTVDEIIYEAADEYTIKWFEEVKAEIKKIEI